MTEQATRKATVSKQIMKDKAPRQATLLQKSRAGDGLPIKLRKHSHRHHHAQERASMTVFLNTLPVREHGAEDRAS